MDSSSTPQPGAALAGATAAGGHVKVESGGGILVSSAVAAGVLE